MPEAASIEIPDGMKPCKVCGEPIKKNALKCVHCASYQDWHAKLGAGSSILGVLVAAISVLAVAVPILINTLSLKNASISLIFQGADEKTIQILASNAGSGPGSVNRYAMLDIETKRGSGATRLVRNGSSMPIVIDEGKNVTLQYQLFYTQEDPIEIPVSDFSELIFESTHCTVNVSINDSNARMRLSDVQVPNCDDLRDFLESAVNEARRQKHKPR